MQINLAALLEGHVFGFMIVFVRLSAAFVLFPGLGEAFVSARIRMMFALAFTVLVYPLLLETLPSAPTQVAALALLVLKEGGIGIFFGIVMRLLMDIVETAGSLIAMETGLSNAMILNPSLATQSALPSAFLGIAALTLLFATGLDHMLFRALMNTYDLFPVGGAMPIGDMAQGYIRLMSDCFTAGIQLAMPFMVCALLLYAVVGMMQRMMPQIQLFILTMPLQILGGFFILMLVVGAIFSVWLKTFDQAVGTFFLR